MVIGGDAVVVAAGKVIPALVQQVQGPLINLRTVISAQGKVVELELIPLLLELLVVRLGHVLVPFRMSDYRLVSGKGKVVEYVVHVYGRREIRGLHQDMNAV